MMTTEIPTPFSKGCGDVIRYGDNGKLAYQVDNSSMESCIWRISPTSSTNMDSLLLVLTILFVHKGPKTVDSGQQYIALPDKQILEAGSKSSVNDGSYEPINNRFSYNQNCHSAVTDAITGGRIKVIKSGVENYFELRTKLIDSKFVISWSFLQCEDPAPPGSLIPFGKLTCPNEIIIKDMGTTWMRGGSDDTCQWTLTPNTNLPNEMLMLMEIYYDDDVTFLPEDYVIYPDGKKVQLMELENRKIRRFSYCTYCLSYASEMQTKYDPITSLTPCHPEAPSGEFEVEIRSSVQVSFTWTFLSCDRLMQVQDNTPLVMNTNMMLNILVALGVILILFTCLILALFFRYEKKSPLKTILKQQKKQAAFKDDDVIDLTLDRRQQQPQKQIRFHTPPPSSNDDVFHPPVTSSTKFEYTVTSDMTQQKVVTSPTHELYATITKIPKTTPGGTLTSSSNYGGITVDNVAYRNISDSGIDLR